MSAAPERKHLVQILLVALGMAGGIVLMKVLDRGGSSGSLPPRELPPAVAAATPSPAEPSKVLREREAAAGSHLDAMSALSEAISNSDRDARAEALRQLAARLVAEDVQAALGVGKRIPDVNDKTEFMRALFAAWAAKDPRAAADRARAEFPPGQMQGECLDAVLEKWAAVKPHEAVQWLDANVHGPLKEQGLAALVQGWTRGDPRAAAAWFAGTGSTSQTVLNALVSSWADLDPNAAATWIETLTSEENKTIGRVALASEWAQQDPARAAAHFTPLMGDARQGIDLAAALVNSWGANDPAGAAAWIDQLGAGKVRDEAAGILATVWAASDIQAAVKWSEKLTQPEMKANVIDHLGTTWGAIEPEKALAWLGTLPEGNARAEATRGAFDSWAGTDVTGLKAWVAKQAAGGIADVARVSLGEVLTQTDPAGAIQAALGITNAAERQDAAAKFFRHWRKADDAAAQRWLQTGWASLPPDVQKRLTKEQARVVVPAQKPL
jgi:hypothetical protein